MPHPFSSRACSCSHLPHTQVEVQHHAGPQVGGEGVVPPLQVTHGLDLRPVCDAVAEAHQDLACGQDGTVRLAAVLVPAWERIFDWKPNLWGSRRGGVGVCVPSRGTQAVPCGCQASEAPPSRSRSLSGEPARQKVGAESASSSRAGQRACSILCVMGPPSPLRQALMPQVRAMRLLTAGVAA